MIEINVSSKSPAALTSALKKIKEMSSSGSISKDSAVHIILEPGMYRESVRYNLSNPVVIESFPGTKADECVLKADNCESYNSGINNRGVFVFGPNATKVTLKNFTIENAKPIEVEPPVIPEIEVNPVINVEPTVENVVEPPVEPVVEAKVEIPAEPAVPDMTSPIAEPEVSVEPVQSEPAIEFKTVEPTIEHIAETEKEAVVEPTIGETENYKELYEKEQLRVEELTKEVNDLKVKLEKITEILKEQ